MTLLMVALGAAVGAGGWLLAIGAAPPRPTLAAVLHRLHTPDSPRPQTWRVRAFATLGLPTHRVRADLALTDIRIEDHLLRQLRTAAAGLLLPLAVTAVLALADAAPAWDISALAGLVLAAVGFVSTDLALARTAARRRTELSHAVSAYLALMRILLAGGAGVESALTEAASISHSREFIQLRTALTTARLTRITPWAALAQLGTDLNVAPLREVAAVVSLAGTEGARVRESLAAKTWSLREREATDTEAAASAATERMALPVALTFVAFLIFLGYPALALVVGGI